MKRAVAGTAGLGKAVEELRERHGELWSPGVNYEDQENSQLALRTNRAISWLEKAVCEHRPGEVSGNDLDVAFILLWIAFNAAYAAEIETGSAKLGREHRLLGDYFEKLLSLDKDKAVYDAIWNKFSGPVRLRMGNKYLYELYWMNAIEKPGGEDWEKGFQSTKEKACSALSRNDASIVLELLFDRLYVLCV